MFTYVCMGQTHLGSSSVYLLKQSLLPQYCFLQAKFQICMMNEENDTLMA